MDVPQLIKNFKYNQPCYVSLSITNYCITAVFVGATKQHFELVDVYTASVPDGAIKGTQIHNYDAVSSALKEIKNSVKQCPSSAAVSLWGNSFIYKLLRYEGILSSKDIASRIETEMTSNMPYAVENMVWDYETITSRKKSAKDTHILLTIAHRPEIEEWTYLLSDVGLKAVLIDTEATSLLNYLTSFTHRLNGRSTACFHLSSEHSTFVALDSSDEFHIREHDFGTLQLRCSGQLSSISRYSVSDVLPAELSEIIAHDSELIAQQIVHAISLCASEIQWTKEFVVYLSGVTALLSPVVERLKKKNINSRLAIPEKHSFNNDSQLLLNEGGTSLAISMGLASRGLKRCHL